jgi:hypothetical protein
MIDIPIGQLEGKTIREFRIYSNAVVIEFSDGRTSAFVGREKDGGSLRMHVATKSENFPGMEPAVTVYRGELPFPGELPDYLA